MLDNLNEQQIKKTAIQLGLPADFIRKDFYITKAIQTLINIKNEHFSLIFQGGTSLSKGHQVVSRLSEDIDFRIILKEPAARLGKEARRKKLRDFRYELITTLKDAKFKVPDESVKVFYEGRFMSISAEFEEADYHSYLKPHIAVECFVGELNLEPKNTEISSLIKLILGEECDHQFFSVPCVALDETTAEKWVALTRRVANTQEKQRKSDKHLVRHLYDLYHLHKKELLTGDYLNIVKTIMEKDKEMFKKQNKAYAENPLRLSELAMDLLFEDQQWQNHWNIFLEQMVYEKDKPSFAQAFDQFRLLSKEILNQIKKAG